MWIRGGELGGNLPNQEGELGNLPNQEGELGNLPNQEGELEASLQIRQAALRDRTLRVFGSGVGEPHALLATSTEGLLQIEVVSDAALAVLNGDLQPISP